MVQLKLFTLVLPSTFKEQPLVITHLVERGLFWNASPDMINDMNSNTVLIYVVAKNQIFSKDNTY